jgi:hypothetical protein
MKIIRVYFKIETYEDVEIENNQSVDDAILTASEIISQEYDYNLDDWKLVKTERVFRPG